MAGRVVVAAAVAEEEAAAALEEEEEEEAAGAPGPYCRRFPAQACAPFLRDAAKRRREETDGRHRKWSRRQ
jgi:hypothetical protein